MPTEGKGMWMCKHCNFLLDDTDSEWSQCCVSGDYILNSEIENGAECRLSPERAGYWSTCFSELQQALVRRQHGEDED